MQLVAKIFPNLERRVEKYKKYDIIGLKSATSCKNLP